MARGKREKPSVEVDVPHGQTPLLHSPNSIVARAQGPQAQLIQTNSISTPVLVLLVFGMSMLGVGVGYAIARANAAADKAAIAEREGRLAEEAAMHLRSTMRAYGITINRGDRKDDLDQEEPVEP